MALWGPIGEFLPRGGHLNQNKRTRALWGPKNRLVRFAYMNWLWFDIQYWLLASIFLVFPHPSPLWIGNNIFPWLMRNSSLGARSSSSLHEETIIIIVIRISDDFWLLPKRVDGRWFYFVFPRTITWLFLRVELFSLGLHLGRKFLPC